MAARSDRPRRRFRARHRCERQNGHPMADLAPELPDPDAERWDPGQRPARLSKSVWHTMRPPPSRDADRASDPYNRLLPDFSNVVQRPSWQQRASCRGVGPEVFFPENGDTSAARALCATCPVAGPCSSSAHHGQEWGVWGGLNRRQRKAVRGLLRTQEDP